MKITFFGHACLELEISGKKIIVDPFISGNEMAKNINVANLKADYILLTHAHQDHTLDVEQIMQSNPNAIIICNAEIATYYMAKNFNCHMMNHGGSWQFDFARVKMVNAIHSSSFADGTYGGNPAGFVIQGEHKNLYIAGDTALTMDMKLIPLFTKLDLAILPIGDNFTMDVNDAILAADFVECDKILGYHYDTFGYIKIDKALAKNKFFNAGKDLMLLDIGESITI
jgi:L-ascorbate metabolism protein UlaG (beta-lactamase superfamily)